MPSLRTLSARSIFTLFRLPTVDICLAAILSVVFFPTAWAGERQQLHGHVPTAVARLAPAGRLDGAAQLNLAIGLPLRNQAALTKLLQDLYDPAAPSYRKFLTPAQFTENFGPAEQDYQAVIKFAEAHGLNVSFKHPNRVILDVKGSVADIEKAFHVAMRTYQHPTEARQFYAPDVEPSLDLAVPVLSISGLDNYSLPHPNIVARPAGLAAPAAPNTGSGSNGTYGGGDFRAAYVPGTSLTGTGQSVGLLEFDGYYASDITAYETKFSLPNISLVNVAVDGGITTPGSGNDEVSLDIEMVMAMAPGISTIYVYECGSGSWVDILNRMANDNLAKQLSCSWADGYGNDPGPPNPTGETILQQMAAQGQSFFVAVGDADAFTGAISFPCDSPNATIVGGTTLTTTGPGGSYVSETVWNLGHDPQSNNNGYEGTGGGISATFSIPTWQQGVSMATNQGSTTMRNVPDVALTADNIEVYYYDTTHGMHTSGSFGGTSCAAPLWAAFAALVNQQAVANGQPTVGFINPAIYALGKNANYTSDFHDTTTGNNIGPSNSNVFSAASGFDLCTGWGSPLGAGLIPSLGGPFTPTVTSFAPASGLPPTSVTITGTNFYGVTNVAFNGTSGVFTVNSPTQITTAVPAGAKTGFITVTTPGGTASSATKFAVFGFSPAYGLPGAAVTLTGSGFTGASAVSFNGVNATAFTVNSDTQITATVPATATTGPIGVTTPGGAITSSNSFTVLTGNGTPTITSFTPASAAVGASVTISGTNFANVSSVSFNGVAATFTVNSQTQITATVPVPSGTVSGFISVTTGLGSATSTSVFTTNAILATYNSATNVPITSNGFTASGNSIYFTLNFVPTTGTNLTVVKNTGLGFISGTFSNLPQGQAVALSYGGITYNFVANYYGGKGNNLVLQWANNRPLAWGLNTYGELGNNSTASSNVLGAVTTVGTPLAGQTVIAVAAGTDHSLALCSNGTLAAWGYNGVGQLGIGSYATSGVVPTAVTTAGTPLAGETVSAMAAGAYHSLAWCSDGTLAAWGYNDYGQLGNNSTNDSNLPTAVTTTGTPLAGQTIYAIAAGYGHSVALCSNGTLAAWGYNIYGQLGNNSTTNSLVPGAVPTAGTPLAGQTVIAVAAGSYHCLALCSNGTLAAWGYNAQGELGIGSYTTSSLVPTAVTTAGTPLAGRTVIAVAAGAFHSLALCSDGTLAAWGYNNDGQLGNNSTNASNLPVAVTTTGTPLAGKTVIAVAAGYEHSLVLCSDGTLAAWGYDSDGELGNSGSVNSLLPVAVNTDALITGEQFTLATSGQAGDHSVALVAEPASPFVTTTGATSISSTGATLNDTIDPSNFSTTVSFEYGTSLSYGTNVAATPSLVSGSNPTAVSVTLTGLTPGTTYHYRVVGVSSAGTTRGPDQTFSTAASVPAMPKWGWVVLPVTLLLVAGYHLPRQRAISRG